MVQGQPVPAEMMSAPHRGYSHLYLRTLLPVPCVFFFFRCLLCQTHAGLLCVCVLVLVAPPPCAASQAFFFHIQPTFFFNYFFIYFELFHTHW